MESREIKRVQILKWTNFFLGFCHFGGLRISIQKIKKIYMMSLNNNLGIQKIKNEPILIQIVPPMGLQTFFYLVIYIYKMCPLKKWPRTEVGFAPPRAAPVHNRLVLVNCMPLVMFG
ncbi:hypothetical protein R6Q59_027245 [Mikania micrantha]